MTSHRTIGATTANAHSQRKRTRGGRLIVLAALSLLLNLVAGGTAFAQDEGTPAPTPDADANRLELEFEELNDSGLSGTATLYEAGDQTIVELELEGTGDEHPAHIHEGTCDDIQPESAYSLENVGREGTSVSLVDVSLSELLEDDFVIDLHLAPNQLGLLIACAEIDGTPVNAEGTPVDIGGPTEPTEEPTEEATEEPTEVATEQPTEEATSEPTTEEATSEPTTEPTEAATEEATQEPTEEPSPTPTPTEDPGDGTGGNTTEITPAGDGTDGGKGIPLTPTPSPVAVGGGTTDSGDGTSGDKLGAGSGKGVPVTTTSSLPASTGSGDSLLLPTTPMGAAAWATASFSLILFGSGLHIRRAVRKQATGRWPRIGL